ncbi:hypothetical protein NYQ32_04425 [Curtobacterium flaccumfaciens]|nr:hypothetical protein [Curtobacterium flaccumfaciens]MCS6554219.1 hypothetical protein [Curtobacterium flaccumfaciens]
MGIIRVVGELELATEERVGVAHPGRGVGTDCAVNDGSERVAIRLRGQELESGVAWLEAVRDVLLVDALGKHWLVDLVHPLVVPERAQQDRQRRQSLLAINDEELHAGRHDCSGREHE